LATPILGWLRSPRVNRILAAMSLSSQFTFQPARPVDATSLATLHTAVAEHLTGLYGRGPWSSRTSEKGVLYALRTSRVFVARLGPEVVGTLRLATKKPWAIDTRYFTPSRRPLYLLALAVMPARQRQGIGRRCLEEAKGAASALAADALRLDAWDATAGAGGFYARCGWEERGRAKYRGTPLIYYEFILGSSQSGAADSKLVPPIR
jgi:GNAT superfamily N-acetyltransferase